MTFAADEESRAYGQPDNLYRFTLSDQVYAYTDGEDAVTLADGTVYLPLPVDRDAVNTTGTLDKSALTVRLPHDSDIPELFRVSPPAEITYLTIFQGHFGDDEYAAIWAGRVLSCKREGVEAALNCEPISTSAKRPGLRVRDQYQCMHALYGPACGVDRAAFTVATLVIGIDGGWLTLPDGWFGSFPAAKFVGGILRWNRHQQMILKVDGNRIKIDGILQDLAPGDTVDLSLGCNHNLDDCRDLFHNVLNFGGCPFIPKRNPIGMVNQFY